MNFQALENINDSRLSVFRLVRDSVLRQSGEIIIDSAKVVRRYLKMGLPLKTLLASEDFIRQNADLLAPWPEAQILAGSRQVLSSIVGHNIHSGVMALGQRPKDCPVDQLGPRVVFFNGVNNSQNVGAIARNALAFGASSIIADDSSCSPYLRRAIRVSMGAIFKCKVHHSQDRLATLESLKDLGYTIYAASLNQRSLDISTLAVPEKSVLIIGCEGHGIDPEVEEAAHHVVHIGMEDGIDSLNAAVASGILLHHFHSAGC